MLIWNPSKLTTAGKALLAKAQAGRCTIKITKAQTGAGSYTSGEAIEGRTALKDVRQTFPVQSKEISNNSTLVLKIVISNKGSDFELKTGYEIREFGIFATDPDKGEILYSIATVSTSDYMPAYNGVIPSVINMSYYLEVANAASVTINSAGALALQTDLDALEARVSVIENAAVMKAGARHKVDSAACGLESWERLGAAIGKVAGVAVGTDPVRNDFMTDIYPYNAMKPVNLSADGKVNAYLGDASFKWDGTNGDVMLEVPLFYTARYRQKDEDGVEWEYRWISSAPDDKLHIHPAFTDGGHISEKIYIPIFNGSVETVGDKDVLRSRAGFAPAFNKTRAAFRTLSKNKGDNWYLDDVWNMALLDQLFIIMFAGTQEQAILGPGRTYFPVEIGKALAAGTSTNYITITSDQAKNIFVGQQIGIGKTGAWDGSIAISRTVTKIEPSTEVEAASKVTFDGEPVNISVGNMLWTCGQNTGETTAMEAPNGHLADPVGGDGKTTLGGRRAIRFLWIEDWYGNMWQFRDGVNINEHVHYVSNTRAEYADDKWDGSYDQIGYTCPSEDGYIKKMGYDEKHPDYEMPEAVGGGADAYIGDYYYQNTGKRLGSSGGNWADTSAAGSFYRHCYVDFGYSSWIFGGRPSCRKSPY